MIRRVRPVEKLACIVVRGFGPAGIDDGRWPEQLTSHAASCLRCQASSARHRRLNSELASLHAATENAPRDLMPRIDNAISSVSPETLTADFVSGVAAATAAVTAGLIAVAVWRRSRVSALTVA